MKTLRRTSAKSIMGGLLFLGLLTSCNFPEPGQNTSPAPTPIVESETEIKGEEGETPPINASDADTPTPTEEIIEYPPVVGPDPSYRAAVFYYPWYGTPALNNDWVHWGDELYNAPEQIGADYYPILGPYSSYDPLVVAQHFAWLREAGVGVVITSWWGQYTYEDKAVPILLEQAERYGIKVAFHIEPYPGRTATSLYADINYIYREYGDHHGFFRTTDSSRWSPDDKAKGLFFVWAFGYRDFNQPPVEPEYWQKAIDMIHDTPNGGLVIANATEGNWVDKAHVDGLYNYATIDLESANGFAWAGSLPPGAWYVPSVLPSFITMRIGSRTPYLPRENGKTYDAQWQAVLDSGVEPQMMTVTSFNEWHEGTQIEPSMPSSEIPSSYAYLDYEDLDPNAYLDATGAWMETIFSHKWPETYPVQIKISTTSDWTTFGLVEGGKTMRPVVISSSESATYAFEGNGRLALFQEIDQAEQGNVVELVIELSLADLVEDGSLRFEIERGHIGWSRVEFFNMQGDEPVPVESLYWAGINNSGRNTLEKEIPAEVFMTLLD